MLSAMRFKTFVWPHNPRDFRVVWQRRVTVLDAPGVANCHCTWRYRENTGMELTLFRGCSLTVNGTRYTFRGAKKPVLVHDSILEIGEVKARFQMFAGVEEVVRG